ncbi:MAG TPA: electron transfer flavoprotein subunit beta/FixA family protein [Gammaproteobacteria bacterium]|nr:electron transfer flavoprotein subunit beta/FixA family protein [Gammaproteobacteria bacterium]
MKVLVPIKRVIDYRVKIRVKTDNTGVVTEHVKMSINPFDEISIEEAVRLKEKQRVSEVILVSIGDKLCQETLRAGLALGADRAILVESDQNLLPRSIAKILQVIAMREQVGLVIMGKQAIDGDHNQTGQRLAACLNWAIGTFVSSIDLQADRVRITREVDAGLEVLELTLPAVLTTDLRLNQPRIATLPNIMQSKQKPLSVIPVKELNLEITTQSLTLRVEAPPLRTGGKILNNLDELIGLLKQEKIIHD